MRSASLLHLLHIGALIFSIVPYRCWAAKGEGLGREPLIFACKDNVRFTVKIEASRATVVTSAASYELSSHRSSIGRRYSSEQVTFIQDQDRGVLAGADGGPFHNCRLFVAGDDAQKSNL